MTPGGTTRVDRVRPGGLAPQPPADYVDAFELVTAEPLGRDIEDLARSALEGAPSVLREAVRLIHGRVLRFDLLDAGRPAQVLGWRIVSSTPQRLLLEADGPLMAGSLTVEALNPVTTRLTTALVHRRRRPATVVWSVVGPIHRLVAPRLMRRTARGSNVR